MEKTKEIILTNKIDIDKYMKSAYTFDTFTDVVDYLIDSASDSDEAKKLSDIKELSEKDDEHIYAVGINDGTYEIIKMDIETGMADSLEHKRKMALDVSDDDIEAFILISKGLSLLTGEDKIAFDDSIKGSENEMAVRLTLLDWRTEKTLALALATICKSIDSTVNVINTCNVVIDKLKEKLEGDKKND